MPALSISQPSLELEQACNFVKNSTVWLTAGGMSLGKALLASLMGHPLASLPSASISPAGVQGKLGTPAQQLDSWELTGKGASAALAERVRQLSAQVSCTLAIACTMFTYCQVKPPWSHAHKAHASSSPSDTDSGASPSLLS